VTRSFALSTTEDVYWPAQKQYRDAQQGNNNKRILQQILTIKHKLLTAFTNRRWTLEEHHVDKQNENRRSTWWSISDDVHWKQFQFFNFNLFCVHLIHRGYDPLDMELVNTGNKVTIINQSINQHGIIWKFQSSVPRPWRWRHRNHLQHCKPNPHLTTHCHICDDWNLQQLVFKKTCLSTCARIEFLIGKCTLYRPLSLDTTIAVKALLVWPNQYTKIQTTYLTLWRKVLLQKLTVPLASQEISCMLWTPEVHYCIY